MDILLRAAAVFLLFLTVATQETINHGSIFGTRFQNIPYKTGNASSAYEEERCKLDVYVPKSMLTVLTPVVVYFHGGSLTSGDKSEGWTNSSNYFGFNFLEVGISMVMVNYRLSGQHETKWPLYLEDAAAAVNWVVNHIRQYGGDPNRIFVMGFSAGAYITHMLNIDPRWFSAVHLNESRVRGYIPISGQTRAHPTVAADLGVAPSELMNRYPDAMPLGHIKTTNKPMHIFVGDLEGQTIVDNYAYYNQLLNQSSTNMFIYTSPGKDHLGMRDGFGDSNDPCLAKTLIFIKNH